MTTIDEVRQLALERAPVRSRTTRKIRRMLLLTAALDLVVLVCVVLAAAVLRTTFDLFGRAAQATDELAHPGLYLVVVWMVVLAAKGGYSRRHFGAGPEEFRTVGVASFVTAALVAIACYMLKVPLSRGFVFYTFLLGTPLLLLDRYVVRSYVHNVRRQGRLMHRVVAVGGPSGVSEVVDALVRSRHVGYEVIGACVPDGLPAEPERIPVPVLGRVGDVRAICEEVGADSVLVARGGYSTSRELRRIAYSLEGSELDLVVVPSLTDVAGPRIHMRPVAGLPLLHVEPPQADEATGMSKRAFDVVGALLAILVLLPVMAAVTALIRLEDRGPILFKQARVGQDGKVFGCFKFRSMFVNAHELEERMRHDAGHDGALWKMERDPRITRIGAVIRRYSLDELPQLFNVVRGEMSLVGPRPQQAWEVDTYTAWEHRRLRVRPGMTGLWQVSGRSQLSFDEAIRLDLYYVDNWSLVSDLVIMAKTVRAVLGKDGAY